MSDFPNRARINNFEEVLSSPIDSSQTTGIILSDVPDYTPGETVQFTILDPQGIEHISATGWSTTTNTLSGVTRGLAAYTGGSSTAVAHGAGVKVVAGVSFQNLDDINTGLESKVDLTGDSMTGDLDWSSTTKQGLVLNSLTTTQRDALGTATDGALIYNSTTGTFQGRDGGAWVNIDTGAASVSNASTTVAGIVEIATQTEANAGTDAGGTGAQLTVGPPELAVAIQNSTYNFAADAEASDTYAITLAPAPAAYATGQKFRFSANTANTGAATLNVNALGAKTIKKFNDQDLATDDIESGSIIEVIYDGTNFQLQTPVASESINNPTKSFTAGESITAADAVCLKANEVEYFAQLTEADLALGDSNVRRRYAIKVIPSETTSTLTTMLFRGKEAATSTMTLTISIQGDSSGEPDGSAITNGTANAIDTSGWGASYANRTATWAAAPTLTAGTTYWIVFEVDATDGVNYIDIGVNSTYDENYLTFTRLTYDLDAGTWGGSATNATPFFWFNSQVKLLGMKVAVCDATDGGKTWGFFGFAKTTVAADANVEVYYDLVPDLSGLTPGANYWLSTTAGEITTTKPNGRFGQDFAYKIGRALSATEIKIELGEKLVWSIETGTNTETLQAILWFKPYNVEVAGSCAGTDVSEGLISNGIFDGNNNYAAVHFNDTNAPTNFSYEITNASFVGATGVTEDFFSGVGSGVTDIGFTYTTTETLTPDNFTFLWKARA